MSNFVKFASAIALAASLAPFAAQARSDDLGTTGPAVHAVQAHRDGALIGGRRAENARFADNIKSFQNRGGISRDA